MTKLEERIEKINSKVTRNRTKQIGNVRFEEAVYDGIVKIAKDLNITKQYLIEQIVKDFLIKD